MLIQNLAKQALSHFNACDTGYGANYTIGENAPKWVLSLGYSPHGVGDYLPDNMRYKLIFEALKAISEHVLLADAWDSIEVESEEQVLTSWLASSAVRYKYVDRAREAYGHEEGSSVLDLIGLGHQMEKREVFDNMIEHLEGYIEHRGWVFQ